MKVNFSQIMVGLEGEQLTQRENVPLTLGFVAAQALNAPKPETVHRNIGSSLERGHLAMKVMRADEIELQPEEASMIRACLDLAWVPVIVAQAHDALAGSEIKGEEKSKAKGKGKA